MVILRRHMKEEKLSNGKAAKRWRKTEGEKRKWSDRGQRECKTVRIRERLQKKRWRRVEGKMKCGDGEKVRLRTRKRDSRRRSVEEDTRRRSVDEEMQRYRWKETERSRRIEIEGAVVMERIRRYMKEESLQNGEAQKEDVEEDTRRSIADDMQ